MGTVVARTVQGLERGHLLMGPLSDSDDTQYLFMVTRVLSKNSVEVVCNTGRLAVTASLSTNRLHSPDTPWQRVRVVSKAPSKAGERLGYLVAGSYAEKD